jgi:hypothetical protein
MRRLIVATAVMIGPKPFSPEENGLLRPITSWLKRGYSYGIDWGGQRPSVSGMVCEPVWLP